MLMFYAKHKNSGDNGKSEYFDLPFNFILVSLVLKNWSHPHRLLMPLVKEKVVNSLTDSHQRVQGEHLYETFGSIEVILSL